MRQLALCNSEDIVICSENSHDFHEFLGVCSGVAEISIFPGYDATPLDNSLPTFRQYAVVSSSKVEMSKKIAFFITLNPTCYKM